VLWVSTKRVRREELLGPTFGKDKWEEKLVKYYLNVLAPFILLEEPSSGRSLLQTT
jgi:hypothetical protein